MKFNQLDCERKFFDDDHENNGPGCLKHSDGIPLRYATTTTTTKSIASRDFPFLLSFFLYR